jgi:hypothetical protein
MMAEESVGLEETGAEGGEVLRVLSSLGGCCF